MGSWTPPTTQTAAARLRELLSDPSKLIVAPGVYDGISARVALSMGFKAIYMVGIIVVERKSLKRIVLTAVNASIDRRRHLHVPPRLG